MRSRQLHQLFRRIIPLALAPSAAIAACGGTIESSGSAPEATATPEPVPTAARGTAPASESSEAGAAPDAGRRDASLDAHVADAPCTTPVPSPSPSPLDGSVNSCAWSVPLPCDYDLDAAAPSPEDCSTLCGAIAFGCYVGSASTGGGEPTPVLNCYSCVAGRRPEGFLASPCAGADVGAYLAASAELEAASVFAFQRLADELAHHGAPSALARRAHRAARDEVRHTKTTLALAARHGRTPQLPSSAPMVLRGRLEVAVENAVEGCVRETYGALVAHVQAERAADETVRAAMRAIANDETDHAALSWAIASWLEAQLDADARAQVRSAFEAAIDALATAAAVDPPRELQEELGLPSAPEAAALVDGLRELLWAA